MLTIQKPQTLGTVLIEQGLLLDPAFAPLVANEQLVRAKQSGR